MTAETNAMEFDATIKVRLTVTDEADLRRFAGYFIDGSQQEFAEIIRAMGGTPAASMTDSDWTIHRERRELRIDLSVVLSRKIAFALHEASDLFTSENMGITVKPALPDEG